MNDPSKKMSGEDERRKSAARWHFATLEQTRILP
jgi:hypothetical protein